MEVAVEPPTSVAREARVEPREGASKPGRKRKQSLAAIALFRAGSGKSSVSFQSNPDARKRRQSCASVARHLVDSGGARAPASPKKRRQSRASLARELKGQAAGVDFVYSRGLGARVKCLASLADRCVQAVGEIQVQAG
eukprot:CAMPEP_0204311176 /NCGR_PEP_ID=MMETSP0469-20131031/2183_1 /ASSEMBLY_ACC=CAM_ASM_000384 /TAXON_ID=2969 /ORGANISM="Oxyrrhis marina" /LENGTH=138 /DNA_ID=CAMNT_0051291089 /DNA_START=95 /DNA_END=511 /DNA_ORIENTATION=-